MKGSRLYSLLWTLVSILLVVPGCVTLAQDCRAEDTNNNAETCHEVLAPLGPATEFTTSSKGIKMALRRWIPEKKEDDTDTDTSIVIKSVVVVVHGGAGWHSGYFDVLGQGLQRHGIAVVAYDQPGSGYSDSYDGIRFYTDSMDTLVADFSMIVRQMRLDYPGKKVFALGESFGAMQLLHHILLSSADDDDDNKADGYILCGTVINVKEEMLPPKPVVAIVKWIGTFLPKVTLPAADVFATFDDAFGDPRWAKAGRADPIVQEAARTPPRLGFAASVLKTADTISQRLDQINVPFAIFTGEKDVRVHPADSFRLYETSPSTDKSLTQVKNGYHQLFQDMPDVTQAVIDGVKDWILARS
jgi:acylglycerol lipase